MHAHDRTLLAKLGFADPDKQSGLHDLACRYLGEPDVALKIAKMCIQKKPDSVEWEDRGMREADKKYLSYKVRSVTTWNLIGVSSVQYEKPVSKGEGQYKTTIGFLDVVLNASLASDIQNNVLWEDGKMESRKADGHNAIMHLASEVKIHPVGVGEILRQINLYREFVGPAVRWLVATHFPITEGEAKQFKTEKVTHVLLGQGFTDFRDAQKLTSAVAAQSVEI